MRGFTRQCCYYKEVYKLVIGVFNYSRDVKKSTVFTWLNATATITLVAKVVAASIQSRPPFDTGKQILSHYFHNRLWAPLSAATN